jgi:hypothetical protein
VFVYNSSNPKNQTLWLAAADAAEKLSRKVLHDGRNGNKLIDIVKGLAKIGWGARASCPTVQAGRLRSINKNSAFGGAEDAFTNKN